MAVRVPPSVRSALWDHQRAAIDAMARYIRQFDANHPRAALVHMPTGSGKTAVIASLARFSDSTGPVIVIAPRIGLREQLARDIERRFFRHAGVDHTRLPRTVVELKSSGARLGNLEDVVIVTTVQLLAAPNNRARRLSASLQRAASLVLFDEGHYEPAAVWSRAIRSFRCPRIVFTATPFRDDFKLFDIDADHVYRYSYERAFEDRYVRGVSLYDYSPVHSPEKFAAQAVEAYNRLFDMPGEDNSHRPRAIIRCDNPEEIRQLVGAVRNRGRSAIGIHETFGGDLAAGEYRKVPDPDVVDATFWIHQFKLLEGIDDPRFQLLALYSELRGMRAFVQQVGRVIRNPGRAQGAIAHVLDHSRRGRQRKLWEDFLQYDQGVGQGDVGQLDLNQRSLVDALQGAVPGLLYVDGRLRRPASVSQLDLGAVLLPLKANLFHKPPHFSITRVQQALVRLCEEDDLFYHSTPVQTDTAAVLYVQVDSSPLLETGFFAEPKLGLSVVHKRGKLLFVFDSHRSLGMNAVDQLGAIQVDPPRLRKLFPRGSGTRLTQISMVNANLGADQVRARAMAAVSIEHVAPSFDEHSYVLRTATGYSPGRRGNLEDGEQSVRRYVGTERGRVSDQAAGPVPFDIWKKWTAELERLLDGKRQGLRVFSRWASDAPVPSDPTPRNVLLDIDDVLDRYITTGNDGLETNQPLTLTDLCADVRGGVFRISANGSSCKVQIRFEPSRQRYELRSPDIDRRYYSTDEVSKEGLVRYLNRTQSLRVIPATTGYFYTLGSFCRPLIKFGPDYDDGKTGVLACLTPIPELRQPMLEKGARCLPDGSGWEAGCLFNVIDQHGHGTNLAPHLQGTEVLVCDDMNDEWADFVLVMRPAQERANRVVFIHAKASMTGSKCSATALQAVCGQAQKHLGEVSLFADPGPSKSAKWNKPWTGAPHTEGAVRDRIRMRNAASDPEDDIRRAVKNPAADREVWLVLGNLLWKEELEALLTKENPPGYAIETAYLLFSTITTVAAAGARLKVFCG